MERTIQLVQPMKLAERKLLRVAAYARVSCDKDEMKHSLAAQISYYNEYIQRRSDWAFAGIYADEAYSGTKDDRPRFVQMIKDCKDGKIDRIITKSISRFARNTVTLLTTVRELRHMGIGIYFEEQNIDTLTEAGELMIIARDLLVVMCQQKQCSDETEANEYDAQRTERIARSKRVAYCYAGAG